MFKQSILRTVCCLAGVLAFGPALGQSPNSDTSRSAPAVVQVAPRNAGPVATASIPRRQPRVEDIPATSDGAPTSALNETQDDVAMNRIIRGICRGC